jgi:hypothetical protein
VAGELSVLKTLRETPVDVAVVQPRQEGVDAPPDGALADA